MMPVRLALRAQLERIPYVLISATFFVPAFFHPPALLITRLVGAEAGLAQYPCVPKHGNLKPQRRHMPFHP